MDQFSRTELLVGKENLERFKNSRVAVFGVGGVGGYVVEALARTGIGTLDLIDNDTVCLSNLNRQIIATHRTIGMYKVDAAKERVLEINPEAVVHTYRTFYLPETASQFDFSQYDYVVDAIDTVTGKLMLVEQAMASGTPIICSMGAGNKMDASAFEVADISETSVCPLAKVMRRELKKRGIEHLKVVYSREKAMTPLVLPEEECLQEKVICSDESAVPESVAGQMKIRNTASEAESRNEKATRRRQTPGSMAFVPSVAGLIIAGEVVQDLMKEQTSGSV